MKKVINIDVMLGERFYCQLRYEYLPCFILDLDEVVKWVKEKKPELKRKEFRIAVGERVSKGK